MLLGESSARKKPLGSQKNIQWKLPTKKCTPLGPMDLIGQLEEGQKLADESLIKYGTVEPPNGGSGGRCLRSACMPAEACAAYYAMTGNKRTLKALKSAIRTFREYRDKARGHRVRYERMDKPLPLDFEYYREEKPTIEYQVISCHVGRNMMGMRAAAHVLKDRQLLEEAADELRWWIDPPSLGYNKNGHHFYASIRLDKNGKPIGKGSHHTLNMNISMACAMWLIGHDLGDDKMMHYGKDAIVKGLPPYQEDNGYFPYGTGSGMSWDGSFRQDGYHSLVCQKLSLLLPYEQWRQNEVFMSVFRRGVNYMRQRLRDNGMMETKPDIVSVYKKIYKEAKSNRVWKDLESPKAPWLMDLEAPEAPWLSTSDLALVSARMRRYLGEADAMTYVHKPLRWLCWNSPSCVPFWPNDEHVGMWHLRTENGYSHCFRRVMLTAWEGIHLRQKGIRDVEAVFVR